jgi:glycosyltransferase involved in cell wall biosynthesis
MRVLHVAEVSHGGVISLVRDFAEAQAAAGHDVHLLLQPDVETKVGTLHHWQPRRRKPLSLLRAARSLRRTVDEVRPDVVHLHSFFPGVLGRL